MEMVIGCDWHFEESQVRKVWPKMKNQGTGVLDIIKSSERYLSQKRRMPN